MKYVLHNKKCNVGTVQVYMGLPPFMLLKITNDDKSDKDCVKIKLRRYTTSQKLDLYIFKMALFDNGEP